MSRDDEGPGDLLDPALRDEIELVSDLVVAASAATRPFTPDEAAALLGLPSQQGDAPQGAPGQSAEGAPGEPAGQRADGPVAGPADVGG